MRRTYAYSGIIIGFLLGLLIGLKTENLVIGIVAALGLSVLAFIIIRVFENMLYKGADKLADKAQDAFMKHQEQKAAENGAVRPQAPAQPLTQFPGRSTEGAAPQRICPKCGNPAAEGDLFCKSCGGKIDE